MKVHAALLAGISFATPALAASPDDADHLTRYAVAATVKTGSFLVGRSCALSLRDEAVPTVIYTVQRRGYGGCQIPDSGQTYYGKREKNSLKLLIKGDKGIWKFEDCPITTMVALPQYPAN